MKIALFLAASLFASLANAKQLYCGSKYFNNTEARVLFTAEIESEVKLRNVLMMIDSEEVRSARQLSGSPYDGRKYKERVAFSLEGRGVKVGKNWWSDVSMSLLLPKNFSKAYVGDKFEAIITETAADGGSYNRVFCEVYRAGRKPLD